jgi:hypothetical protein
MTIRERINSLRAEADRLEQPAREEAQTRQYLDALQRERAGVVDPIRVARALGDRRETLYSPLDPDGPWIPATKTGNEVAAELEHRLACVDYEIRRVTP